MCIVSQCAKCYKAKERERVLLAKNHKAKKKERGLVAKSYKAREGGGWFLLRGRLAEAQEH
jgi:hypothetical protein